MTAPHHHSDDPVLSEGKAPCRPLLPVNPLLGVALAVLLVAGAAVAALARLGHTRAMVTAGLRATVQLAAVAVVIGFPNLIMS